MKKRNLNISYTRLIALSFFCVILVGTFLLVLPISAGNREWTPLIDAMFTATSATCVTGLAVYDTYQYWSLFGQFVLLFLIQIGGLGFMTIISLVAVFMKKRIGLHERKILMASSGNMRLSGMIQLIKKIATITFCCEGIGAFVLAFTFVPEFGFFRGIYYAVFHSVSAFCNAGFDLMGIVEPGSSLGVYEHRVSVMIPISILIIVGGIGFQVWGDILHNRLHVRKYSLHTKVVLTTTAALLVGGAVLYGIFEANGHLKGMSFGERLLSCGFLSVTTRTAGFSGFDLRELSPSGSLLTMMLMVIGGSPGSTAGGMKTTTLAVMIMAVRGMSLGEKDITIFKRRLNKDLIKQAAVILFVYLVAVLSFTMIICCLEATSLERTLFETCSALGTAGLTQGLSESAGGIAKILLAILMYGGRIGGLSLLLVFAERKAEAVTKRPAERIMLG